MAVAEQQQNLVNQAVKELQITEERIQKVIAGQTHHTVSKSLNTGLQEGTAELVKTAKALGRLKIRLIQPVINSHGKSSQ